MTPSFPGPWFGLWKSGQYKIIVLMIVKHKIVYINYRKKNNNKNKNKNITIYIFI